MTKLPKLKHHLQVENQEFGDLICKLKIVNKSFELNIQALSSQIENQEKEIEQSKLQINKNHTELEAKEA